MEIEILSEQRIEPQVKGLPFLDDRFAYFERCGKIDRYHKIIFIEKTVLDEVRAHAQSKTNAEIGGILMGDYGIHGGIRFLVISGCIKAEKGISRAGLFRFTIEALTEIDQIRERDFQDKLTLGWYHSHPGFGVFLSHIDMDSHKRIFTQEYHLALVVDPIQEKEGFFLWHDDKIIGPAGYFIIS